MKWTCQRERLANQLRISLVSRRVVHDDVHVEIRGHVARDFVEELAELLGAVARHAFADDRSRFHNERGEHRRRAVAFVVVDAPLDPTRPQRQQRFGAVQRLDLALFIDAEHQSPLRRVDVSKPAKLQEFLPRSFPMMKMSIGLFLSI